jgi:hypothetical protein
MQKKKKNFIRVVRFCPGHANIYQRKEKPTAAEPRI